jgi:hypothetical protein
VPRLVRSVTFLRQPPRRALGASTRSSMRESPASRLQSRLALTGRAYEKSGTEPQPHGALDSRRASGGMADAPALGAIPALRYASRSVVDASGAELCATRTHENHCWSTTASCRGGRPGTVTCSMSFRLQPSRGGSDQGWANQRSRASPLDHTPVRSRTCGCHKYPDSRRGSRRLASRQPQQRVGTGSTQTDGWR